MRELFTGHPASVGETYFQHMGQALSFAAIMLFGFVVCLTHAFLPFLFVKTGSGVIQGLNARMVANRVTQSGSAQLQKDGEMALR